MDLNLSLIKDIVIHDFSYLSLGRYEYTDNNGKVMFEYHVDTITEFQKIMDDNFFVVNLRVTMGVGVLPLI